jgi:hypothetical protein
MAHVGRNRFTDSYRVLVHRLRVLFRLERDVARLLCLLGSGTLLLLGLLLGRLHVYVVVIYQVWDLVIIRVGAVALTVRGAVVRGSGGGCGRGWLSG